MKLWKGLTIAFVAVCCTLSCEEMGDFYDDDDDDNEIEDFYDEGIVDNSCEDVIVEPCEEEYWVCEICYEPQVYTKQTCVQRQVPVKKKCCRMVPKEFTVMRVRYVPEYYTETIVKNELQQFYVDDIKICNEMVCEQQCEWVPKKVWKKIAKESCEE